MNRTTPGIALRAALLVLAIAAPLAPVGCSPGPQRAAAVDPASARTALQSALDAWKAGQKPADLKAGSPAITVQDLDWESGSRLVSYEVKSEGTHDNANLRIPVSLTLSGPSGGEQTKEVTYVVGTSPAITVFRELF
jgi:hypothetical protein